MAVPACSTPRVRVAALLTLNNKVVLVRHQRGKHSYHLLPGGGVRTGETLAEALMRETVEETGLLCRIGRPVVLNDTLAPDGTRHVINITFFAEVIGGQIRSNPADTRIVAVDVVAPEALISLDLRPPIAKPLLEALRDPTGFHAVYAGSLFSPEPS